MKKILVAMAAVFACAVVHAEGSNWRFFAGLGIGNGGDTITTGTVTTIGTNNPNHFEIKPGSGLQYRMGLDYRLASRLFLQASIGYSADDPMGMNGSLTFITIPTEFLGFVGLTESLRIGGGVRNSSAEMKASGLAAGWAGAGTYSSTPGGVVEAQYLGKVGAQGSQFGVSARYVSESFSHNGVSFSGNHYEIGLVLYY